MDVTCKSTGGRFGSSQTIQKTYSIKKQMDLEHIQSKSKWI
jgi:hypothetical protein